MNGPYSRRDLLKQLGAGFGLVGLAGVLAETQAAPVVAGDNPLAIKRPHM